MIDHTAHRGIMLRKLIFLTGVQKTVYIDIVFIISFTW